MNNKYLPKKLLLTLLCFSVINAVNLFPSRSECINIKGKKTLSFINKLNLEIAISRLTPSADNTTQNCAIKLINEQDDCSCTLQFGHVNTPALERTNNSDIAQNQFSTHLQWIMLAHKRFNYSEEEKVMIYPQKLHHFDTQDSVLECLSSVLYLFFEPHYSKIFNIDDLTIAEEPNFAKICERFEKHFGCENYFQTIPGSSSTFSSI